MAAQSALAWGAILAPEIVYGRYELHKSLFYRQLDTLIKTLPDFPYVQKDLREIAGIRPLMELWQRLGFTNEDWRSKIKEFLINEFEAAPELGAKLLNTGNEEFQARFNHILHETIINELETRMAKGTLKHELVNNVHPIVWIILWYNVSENLRRGLLTLLPHLEDTFENDQQFADEFEKKTTFTFRSPFLTMACDLLLDNMKMARAELLEKKVFTESDVEEMGGDVIAAIGNIGLMHFIEEAELVKGMPDILTIETQDGHSIPIREDFLLFGDETRQNMLSGKLKKMNPTEKRALCERLCVNPIDVVLLQQMIDQTLRDVDYINQQITQIDVDLNKECEKIDQESDKELLRQEAFQNKELLKKQAEEKSFKAAIKSATVEKSKMPSELIFLVDSGPNKGTRIRFSSDRHFFGARKKLVALKEVMDSLSYEEKEALFQALCNDDAKVKVAFKALRPEVENERVQCCFKLICELREVEVGRKAVPQFGVRPDDATKWAEAYDVNSPAKGAL